MTTEIKDGFGTGGRARVDQYGQLYVHAVSSEELHSDSLAERAFGVGTIKLPLTANGGFMLWLKHTNTEADLIVHDLWVSWNGGDTNHDRCCELQLYEGGSIPTANEYAITAKNLNLGSAKQAAITAYMWNTATGDGLTIATPGNLVGEALIAKGFTKGQFTGALIVPPEKSLAIKLIPEEAGNATLMLLTAFHHP